MTDDELAVVRRAFARQMTRGSHPAVERAFGTVRREHFLGTDPWRLIWPGQPPWTLPDNDPVQLYQDVLVSLDAARGVNNGSPSLHALMLAKLAVEPGDRVVHVGAGSGYYSAILAELAGADGHVTAIEFDPALAEAARRNLEDRSNLTVLNADGADPLAVAADCIYVNFATTRPAEAWLDALAPGGRLVFPLATRDPASSNQRTSSRGAVLLVTRTPAGYAADHVSPCGFVVAEGSLAGTPDHQRALIEAFDHRRIRDVTSLRRGESTSERCWFWCPEWSLSYDPPG